MWNRFMQVFDAPFWCAICNRVRISRFPAVLSKIAKFERKVYGNPPDFIDNDMICF